MLQAHLLCILRLPGVFNTEFTAHSIYSKSFFSNPLHNKVLFMTVITLPYSCNNKASFLSSTLKQTDPY